jgi:hypothetical protein
MLRAFAAIGNADWRIVPRSGLANIDTETVQTVVSPNPRTRRIAVTGGTSSAIMDTAPAVAAEAGRSTTASYGFSHSP